jgi:hypothetical protein
MIDSISHIARDNKTATAALYVAGLSFIVADVVPTPADAAYFYLQRKDKEALEAGKMTNKQYWIRDAVYYYTLNPLWWGLVLGAMVFTKGSAAKKAKIGLALLGTGMVVGVLHKNIVSKK